MQPMHRPVLLWNIPAAKPKHIHKPFLRPICTLAADFQFRFIFTQSLLIMLQFMRRRVPSPSASPPIHKHRLVQIYVIFDEEHAVLNFNSYTNDKNSYARGVRTTAMRTRQPSSTYTTSIHPTTFHRSRVPPALLLMPRAPVGTFIGYSISP